LTLLQLHHAGARLDLYLSSKLGCFGLDTLAETQGLVAGFDGRLPAGGLGLAAGVLQQRLGLLLGRAEHLVRLFALVERPKEEAEDDARERSEDGDDGLHGGLLYTPSGRGHPAGESHPATPPRPSSLETAAAPSGARRCRDPAITVRRSGRTA